MKEEIIKTISKFKYIIEFMISIILIVNIQQILISTTEEIHVRYRYIIFTVVFAILLLIFIIISIEKNIRKLEKIFLTFMIPIGILYIVFVLPNRAYDEGEHIYRAYNVSKGIIVAEQNPRGEAKTLVPMSIIRDFGLRSLYTYEDISQAMNEDTQYDDEKMVFNSAQGYSPTLYIFSAIVFNIGRHFNINFVILAYIARLCNFIFFLVLGYYSIKLIPFGKLLMFAYLFNPMIIHQAVSLSADSMIDSITLFFIAYVIKLINSKDNITIKDKIIFTCISIATALAKYVYFPLIFIAGILLFKKENIKKKDKNFIIIITIICLILAIGWYLVSSKYVDLRGYITKHNVNATEQIKYVIKHPISFIGVIINTTYVLGEKVFTEFLGYRISPEAVFTSIPCLFAYALLLIASVFVDKHEDELDKRSKIIVGIIAFMLYSLVLAGMYLIWTGVGEPCVADLQGRYFIPVFILPLICMINKNRTLNYNVSKVYVFYAIALSLVNIQTLVPTIDQILHF